MPKKEKKKEFRWKCPVCGYEAKSEEEKERHLEKTHEDAGQEEEIEEPGEAEGVEEYENFYR